MGNGKNVNFCEGKWLQEGIPKAIALAVYSIAVKTDGSIKGNYLRGRSDS